MPIRRNSSSYNSGRRNSRSRQRSTRTSMARRKKKSELKSVYQLIERYPEDWERLKDDDLFHAVLNDPAFHTWYQNRKPYLPPSEGGYQDPSLSNVIRGYMIDMDIKAMNTLGEDAWNELDVNRSDLVGRFELEDHPRIYKRIYNPKTKKYVTKTDEDGNPVDMELKEDEGISVDVRWSIKVMNSPSFKKEFGDQLDITNDTIISDAMTADDIFDFYSEEDQIEIAEEFDRRVESGDFDPEDENEYVDFLQEMDEKYKAEKNIVFLRELLDKEIDYKGEEMTIAEFSALTREELFDVEEDEEGLKPTGRLRADGTYPFGSFAHDLAHSDPSDFRENYLDDIDGDNTFLEDYTTLELRRLMQALSGTPDHIVEVDGQTIEVWSDDMDEVTGLIGRRKEQDEIREEGNDDLIEGTVIQPDIDLLQNLKESVRREYFEREIYNSLPRIDEKTGESKWVDIEFDRVTTGGTVQDSDRKKYRKAVRYVLKNDHTKDIDEKIDRALGYKKNRNKSEAEVMEEVLSEHNLPMGDIIVLPDGSEALMVDREGYHDFTSNRMEKKSKRPRDRFPRTVVTTYRGFELKEEGRHPEFKRVDREHHKTYRKLKEYKDTSEKKKSSKKKKKEKVELDDDLATEILNL